MKLADCNAAYQDRSSTASTIARQLGFAGLGIIWTFRTSTPAGQVVLQGLLLLVAILIVLSLSADLIQYLVSTIIWGCFHRRKELQGIEGDVEFKAPRYLNWPALVFFVIKQVSMVMAYVFLFTFLLRRLA